MDLCLVKMARLAVNLVVERGGAVPTQMRNVAQIIDTAVLEIRNVQPR